MLAEFVRELVALGRRADSIEIESHESLPEVLFVRKGDRYEEHEVPPTRRTGSVNGYADLIAVMKDDGLVLADPEGGAKEVFHDHSGIVVHLDRLDRRDTFRLALLRSQRFQTLEGLAAGSSMDQQAAIRMLRFGLHGSGVEKLIVALRKVDFTRKSDGRSHLEHGRESLGNSVEAAVQPTSEIPETFMVSVPVYINPGFAELTLVEVWCGISIDLQASPVKFEIRPLADELHSAVLRAQASIGAKLAADLPGTAIFNGRP